MRWNKPKIIQEIRRLNRKDEDLSYNAMTKRHQPLVSAAAYHFGSYRRAVEQAGIDYASLVHKPRWTRPRIIEQIKRAKRRGEELNWSSVTRDRSDELSRAAFAALQPRLFGSWDRALQAAGLDADAVSRYRSWDRNTVVSELKSKFREGEAVNSGTMQSESPDLHAAAVRRFGSYSGALKAAGIDPNKVRQRRVWSREEVLRRLRQLKRQGVHLSDTTVRTTQPALYGAAIRLFGKFTAARSAAGIKWNRPSSPGRREGRSGRIRGMASRPARRRLRR